MSGPRNILHRAFEDPLFLEKGILLARQRCLGPIIDYDGEAA